MMINFNNDLIKVNLPKCPSHWRHFKCSGLEKFFLSFTFFVFERGRDFFENSKNNNITFLCNIQVMIIIYYFGRNRKFRRFYRFGSFLENFAFSGTHVRLFYFLSIFNDIKYHEFLLSRIFIIFDRFTLLVEIRQFLVYVRARREILDPELGFIKK